MKKLLLSFLAVLAMATSSHALTPFIGNVQLSTGGRQNGGFNVSTGTMRSGMTLPFLTQGYCMGVNGTGQVGDIVCGAGTSFSNNLAVNQDGVEVSSPTIAINLVGTDLLGTLVGGSTAQLSLNPAYPYFVHIDPLTSQQGAVAVTGTINTDTYYTIKGINFLTDGGSIGNNNVTIGANAGNLTMTGFNNVCAGYTTCSTLTTGLSNTAVGTGAGASLTTANANTLLGFNAGNSLTTGGFSVMVGDEAGTHVTTGDHNILIGEAAGTNLGSGSNNTLIGYINGQTLAGAASNNNTTLGATVLNNLISGQANTCLGFNSCVNLQTASSNTIVGATAFQTTIGGFGGDANTFMGFGAGNSNSTITKKAIGIGYNAIATSSNTAVIGGSGEDGVQLIVQSASTTYGANFGSVTVRNLTPNSCVQTDASGNLASSGSGCGGSGGGGTGFIEVLVNGVRISSPTQSFSFSSAFTGALTGGATAVIGLSPSSATLQGNNFNAAGKLVQLSATNKYPSADGSLITGIPYPTIYPATATASFPFGLSASTGVFSSSVTASALIANGLDAGTFTGVEGGARGGITSSDILWADSADHWFKFIPNNGQTYFVMGSSSTNTAGHTAVFSANGSIIDGGTNDPAALLLSSNVWTLVNTFSSSVTARGLSVSSGVYVFKPNSPSNPGDILLSLSTNQSSNGVLFRDRTEAVIMTSFGARIGSLHVSNGAATSIVPTTDANNFIDFYNAATSSAVLVATHGSGQDIIFNVATNQEGVRFSQTRGAVFKTSSTFNGNLGISSGIFLSGSAGTIGQALVSGGSGAVPTWGTVSASAAGSTGNVQVNQAGTTVGRSNFNIWSSSSVFTYSGNIGVSIGATAAATEASSMFDVSDSTSNGVTIFNNQGQTVGSANSMLTLISSNTTYGGYFIRIFRDSPNSNGEIRVDSPNPNYEMKETDTGNDNDSFEIGINNGISYWATRNGANNSFERTVNFPSIASGAPGIVILSTGSLKFSDTAASTLGFKAPNTLGASWTHDLWSTSSNTGKLLIQTSDSGNRALAWSNTYGTASSSLTTLSPTIFRSTVAFIASGLNSNAIIISSNTDSSNNPITWDAVSSGTANFMHVLERGNKQVGLFGSGTFNINLAGVAEGIVIVSSIPNAQIGAAMLRLESYSNGWNDYILHIIRHGNNSGPGLRIDANDQAKIELQDTSRYVQGGNADGYYAIQSGGGNFSILYRNTQDSSLIHMIDFTNYYNGNSFFGGNEMQVLSTGAIVMGDGAGHGVGFASPASLTTSTLYRFPPPADMIGGLVSDGAGNITVSSAPWTGSWTVAQLAVTVPARVGQMAYCSNCTAALCVSTATSKGSWSSAAGKTTTCY